MKNIEQWTNELQQFAQKLGKPGFEQYVIEACRERRAFLFFAPDGWVVVEPRVSPLRHVFVLAAYCTGHNAIARYEPALFDFAARLGISVLRFEAARPGYNRTMPQRGWQRLDDGKTWEKG